MFSFSFVDLMLVCLGSININTLHYIFLYKNLYKYGKERDQIFFLFALLSASFHPSISVIKKIINTQNVLENAE